MISEDHDDAESANTQAPNQDEERRDDNDYTALVLLVRDGCYGKVLTAATLLRILPRPTPLYLGQQGHLPRQRRRRL
ncbi:hypothetical protein CFRS1_v000041 [Colletotrichum fructicola]|nr:hypothetical protein CFRS1_v000041 [Colletotrichum fructicola]